MSESESEAKTERTAPAKKWTDNGAPVLDGTVACHDCGASVAADRAEKCVMDVCAHVVCHACLEGELRCARCLRLDLQPQGEDTGAAAARVARKRGWHVCAVNNSPAAAAIYTFLDRVKAVSYDERYANALPNWRGARNAIVHAITATPSDLGDDSNYLWPAIQAACVRADVPTADPKDARDLLVHPSRAQMRLLCGDLSRLIRVRCGCCLDPGKPAPASHPSSGSSAGSGSSDGHADMAA